MPSPLSLRDELIAAVGAVDRLAPTDREVWADMADAVLGVLTTRAEAFVQAHPNASAGALLRHLALGVAPATPEPTVGGRASSGETARVAASCPEPPRDPLTGLSITFIPAERRAEYEICKRRGHQAADIVLSSMPPQHVCKWCGTRWIIEPAVIVEIGQPDA